MAGSLTRPSDRRLLHRFLFTDLTREAPLRGAPGLEHARRFAARLGDPQESARPVHVVGTAGKGTAAATITATLVRSGMSVGTHMSPHVDDVRERFQIDGRLPAWEGVLAVAAAVHAAATSLLDETGRPPSFFAATLGMAWQLGHRADVSVQVTEAGIGGRFDASNVIRRPDKLTVITNIGLDHRDALGPTVAAIAAEKAAVIVPGGVVVVAPQTHSEAFEVVAEAADRVGARLIVADQGVTDWREAARPIARLVGEQLGADITSEPELVASPGRGEEWVVDGHRLVVDGAHNPLKLRAMVAALDAGGITGAGPEDRLMVVALGAEKDLVGCSAILAAAASRFVVTEFGSIDAPTAHPRSWPAGTVAAALADHGGLVVGEEPAHARAADLARAAAASDATIVVTGSFFHLAAVRDRLVATAARARQSTPR